MSNSITDWNAPSDPCPKCGSKHTAVRDFHQDVFHVPQLGGPPIIVPRNPQFFMSCEDCGHKEFKLGYPRYL